MSRPHAPGQISLAELLTRSQGPDDLPEDDGLHGLHAKLYDLYIKVHKITREEKATTPKMEDKMAYFMLVSSKVCGYNLKDFFIQWGFKLPQEAFDALDALNLPEPEIDLLKLRE